jgi:Tol biopolymer transport system component
LPLPRTSASRASLALSRTGPRVPSYSPDGKKIAYTGYNGAGYDDIDFVLEIYTINIGGGGKSQVTASKSYASQPSWGIRP